MYFVQTEGPADGEGNEYLRHKALFFMLNGGEHYVVGEDEYEEKGEPGYILDLLLLLILRFEHFSGCDARVIAQLPWQNAFYLVDRHESQPQERKAFLVNAIQELAHFNQVVVHRLLPEARSQILNDIGVQEIVLRYYELSVINWVDDNWKDAHGNGNEYACLDHYQQVVEYAPVAVAVVHGSYGNGNPAHKWTAPYDESERDRDRHYY